MGWFKFLFGRDDDDGSYRQDRLEGERDEGRRHEHAWSKTSPDGQHKEGWLGKDAPRERDGHKK